MFRFYLHHKILVFLAFLLVCCAVPLCATDYYVSATGNDNASGSLSSPWKTIARVNKAHYLPGDRIFFEGGSTFYGHLYFDSTSAGTPKNPIVVGSYGNSRAVISAGNGYGLYAHNTAGFLIGNINFVGAGNPSSTQSGIFFYTALAGNVKLDTISIDHVDVSGFGTGISIGSWNGLTGYQNVSITNSASHDNAVDGINIYGYTSASLVGYPHRNIYIGHVIAYNNTGVADSTRITGNGIVVGNSDGVVIERSQAYNNGANNTHNGGPVGIWTWDSNNVVMQFNESHHNHTASVDGDGFDLDGGTTNSVMQYNYSHDNDGAGFLICEYTGARPYGNNTVRYNISQNDGRKNGDAGIQFWNGGSGVNQVQVFNNTVYVSPAPTMPKALYLQSATSNVAIRNNILISTDGAPVMQVAPGQKGLVLQGNDYWASGQGLKILWPGATYTNLSSFRAATGQETYNGMPVGSSVDPQLSAPGTAGTIGNSDLLNTLTAYSPRPGSPMIDTALTLSTMFGVNPGATDFLNTSVYRGLAFDVGAVEY